MLTERVRTIRGRIVLGKSAVEFESSGRYSGEFERVVPGRRDEGDEGGVYEESEGNERDGDSRKRREGNRGVGWRRRGKRVEVFHSAIRIQGLREDNRRAMAR